MSENSGQIFGKILMTVVLSIISLFSFFAPVVYMLSLLLKLINISSWEIENIITSIVIFYVIYWTVVLVCLAKISNMWGLSQKIEAPESGWASL